MRSSRSPDAESGQTCAEALAGLWLPGLTTCSAATPSGASPPVAGGLGEKHIDRGPGRVACWRSASLTRHRRSVKSPVSSQHHSRMSGAGTPITAVDAAREIAPATAIQTADRGLGKTIRDASAVLKPRRRAEHPTERQPTQEVPAAMIDNSEQTLTLSVEEAAGLLGISRGLAYELVHRGELAAIKLGRRILVPRHVIESLVNRPGNGA
jgi:excisionase family DNA binding protein